MIKSVYGRVQFCVQGSKTALIYGRKKKKRGHPGLSAKQSNKGKNKLVSNKQISWIQKEMKTLSLVTSYSAALVDNAGKTFDEQIPAGTKYATLNIVSEEQNHRR